jgi:hypothetical protein
MTADQLERLLSPYRTFSAKVPGSSVTSSPAATCVVAQPGTRWHRASRRSTRPERVPTDQPMQRMTPATPQRVTPPTTVGGSEQLEPEPLGALPHQP